MGRWCWWWWCWNCWMGRIENQLEWRRKRKRKKRKVDLEPFLCYNFSVVSSFDSSCLLQFTHHDLTMKVCVNTQISGINRFHVRLYLRRNLLGNLVNFLSDHCPSMSLSFFHAFDSAFSCVFCTLHRRRWMMSMALFLLSYNFEASKNTVEGRKWKKILRTNFNKEFSARRKVSLLQEVFRKIFIYEKKWFFESWNYRFVEKSGMWWEVFLIFSFFIQHFMILNVELFHGDDKVAQQFSCFLIAWLGRINFDEEFYRWDCTKENIFLFVESSGKLPSNCLFVYEDNWRDEIEKLCRKIFNCWVMGSWKFNCIWIMQKFQD